MKKRGPSGVVLISIAIHIALILAIGLITFHYPIAQLVGIPRAHNIKAERLQYIVLPKGERTGNGSSATPAPARKGTPAPLLAPSTIPTALPPVPPPSQSQGAVSGKPGGQGGAPAGAATGVEPELPDPRVTLIPYPYSPVPRTPAEQVDSLVRSAFGVYMDSAQVAAARAAGRQPGDLTVTTKGGDKWGWDQKGIQLGKFTIPNAVLAALPLAPQGRNINALTEGRNAAWVRNDILEHARASITEDEFRNAVRRIRERKERERQEKTKEKDKRVIADAKNASTPN
jgi:hypothetical protein